SAGQRSTHALLGGFVEISTAGKRRRKKIRGKTKEEVERKMQPHMTGDAVDSEAENLRKLGARSITQLERNLQELWRAKQRQQMAPRFGGATRKAKKNNEEG